MALWNIYANNSEWNSFAWRAGYQTIPGGRISTATPLFTTTLGQSRTFQYYSRTTRLYKAWAIIWTVVNVPTTFVLTNEGGLIDNLIGAGHGGKNLYQVLQLLQPNSGGAIPQSFLDLLAACPAGSEVLTTALSNFAGANNPVCVNSNGTLSINAVFASDYSGHAGFRDIPGARSGSGNVQYTLAILPEKYIGAGNPYYAFGIAWASPAAPTTVVLSNEGGLIDDLVTAGHGSKSLYQVLQLLQPMSGGAIPKAFMDALAACPAGSDILTEPLTTFADFENNPICINSDGTAHVASIYGKDHYGRAGFTTFQGEAIGSAAPNFVMARGPASYIDAGSGSLPGGGSYNVLTIIWAITDLPSTFVLSNESPGYLIDNLIAQGHGDKSLYEVLQILQPQSGGAIPQSFMDILAGCPAESETNTVALSNFAGLNNPVSVNSDGWLGILPVFGHDYVGETGYTTVAGPRIGNANPLYTSADSKEYYIDGGSRYDWGVLEGYGRYNVFAIGWATAPTIGLSRTVLNFGAERNATVTPVGTSRVSNTGSGTLNWTATPSAGWLTVTPGSGTNAGLLTIGIADTSLATGVYQGTVTVSDPAATNNPQVITVNYQVYDFGTNGLPFGSFDTPIDQTTVSSSIPVTGWALDDIGLQSVKIYRGTDASDRIYIGDAVFVEGARHDVEAAYPGYPQNDKAGWGYMLLTNFLPLGGTDLIRFWPMRRTWKETKSSREEINHRRQHDSDLAVRSDRYADPGRDGFG